MTRASSGQIYTWKGITPTGSRCWAMTKDKMDELDATGRIHWPAADGGMPRLKFDADEAPGIPLQDIWDDVGAMHNLSSERLDYPTQKPESFVERIVRTSSNEGDLVADFFIGSALRRPSQKSLAESGSGQTSASSGFTQHASASSRSNEIRRLPGNRSARSRS